MQNARIILLILFGLFSNGQSVSVSCPRDGLLDLVIALDSSSSVGMENWKLTLDFTTSLIREYNVAFDSTNIGVFRFNRIVDEESRIFLNTYPNNITALTQAVNAIPYKGAGTNTGKAVEYARLTMFNVTNGDRPEASNVFLLITDGDVRSGLLQARVLSRNTDIYAIAISKDVKYDQIKAFSKPNEPINVTDFDELSEIASSLASRLDRIRPCSVNFPVCMANRSEVEETVAIVLATTESDLQQTASLVIDQIPVGSSTEIIEDYVHIRRQVHSKKTFADEPATFSLPGKSISFHAPPNINPTGSVLLQVAQVQILPRSEPTCTFYETQGIDKAPFEKNYAILPTDFLAAFGLQRESGVMPGISVEWNSQMSFEQIDSTVFESTSAFGSVLFTDIQFECGFVDVNINRFSSKGCRRIETDRLEAVTCYCNHTTTFATLLSVSVVEIPDTAKILSFMMELLSIVFLFITLLILIVVRKKIKNDRTITQINLTTALLLFHLSNLFYDLAFGRDGACVAIAAIIHYFLLSTGTWMVAEGIGLLIKTSKDVLKYTGRKASAVRICNFLLGWAVPAVIVGVSFGVGFANDSYLEINKAFLFQSKFKNISDFGLPSMKKFNQCWFSPGSSLLLFAVIVPVAICVLVNICISIRVAVFVAKVSFQMKRSEPQRKDLLESQLLATKDALRAIIVLFPSLGIPWILSFLVGVGNYQTSLAFLYLNAIVNGLQGVFLFIVYCIIGREVRKAIIRLLKR